MALHPQAQAVVDRISAIGAPPLHELPIEQARQFSRGLAGLTGEAEPVHLLEDRTIPTPDGELPVRIYRPAGNGPFPMLLNFHGGGWALGDLDLDDVLCRALANAVGMVVIGVDYRLTPEVQFPAPLDDAMASLRWAHEQALVIGGDPERIAVLGESAGGNLAAALALRARDEGGPALCFQLLMYPALDSSMDTRSYEENAEGYFLSRDLMIWAWKNYAGDADRTHPYMSPLHATDLSGLPPALIITAEYDPLRDEGQRYAQRLRDAGVPAVDHCYPGMFHGFALMGAVLDTAAEAVAECTGALKAAFATDCAVQSQGATGIVR